MAMKLRIGGLFAISAIAIVCLLVNAQSLAQNAYIVAGGFNGVSVIDTATDAMTATFAIPPASATWCSTTAEPPSRLARLRR
jgi:hypothetical protein